MICIDLAFFHFLNWILLQGAYSGVLVMTISMYKTVPLTLANAEDLHYDIKAL